MYDVKQDRVVFLIDIDGDIKGAVGRTLSNGKPKSFLFKFLSENNYHLEVCVSSNIKTKTFNKIEDHFEKKAIVVKLAACEINKDNKEWRESVYHRCGDDVIIL